MWSSVQEPVRGLQTPLLCTGDLKTKLNGGINFQLKKKQKTKKKKQKKLKIKRVEHVKPLALNENNWNLIMCMSSSFKSTYQDIFEYGLIYLHKGGNKSL